MTLDLTSLIILALATWRLSYMLTAESLPFNIGSKLRARFPLGGLTTCIYCMSVWVAILMLGLWYTDLYPIVYVLAITGGAMVMRSYTGVGIND